MSTARPARPRVLGGTGALLAAILLLLALGTPALAKLGDLKVSLEAPPFDPGDSQNVITDGTGFSRMKR